MGFQLQPHPTQFHNFDTISRLCPMPNYKPCCPAERPIWPFCHLKRIAPLVASTLTVLIDNVRMSLYGMFCTSQSSCTSEGVTSHVYIPDNFLIWRNQHILLLKFLPERGSLYLEMHILHHPHSTVCSCDSFGSFTRFTRTDPYVFKQSILMWLCLCMYEYACVHNL